jgi:methylphosphotriester-DNA--protein-cysteine methyltransferase
LADETLKQLYGTLVSTIWRSGHDGQQLECFLRDVDSSPTDDVRLVRTACATMYASDGQVRVREVARACSLSLRQFERRFKAITGFTPKLLARLIRFEALRDRLLHVPVTRSTDLAYDFGYTDQTHLIREFKTFAGRTPTQFIDAAIQRGMSHFYYLPDHRALYHARIVH